MENIIEEDRRVMPRLEALHALCAGRHSTRTFAERPVPPDLIARILDVARTAPYASGKKNWEVVVVTDANKRACMVEIVRRKANALQAAIRSDFQGEFAAYAEHFSAFASAPVILVPTFRIAPSLSLMCGQTPVGENDTVADLCQWERNNYVKSISCVSMLMLLAAEAAGLGACYMTGPLLAEAELAAAIGAKRGRNLAALIPIGYREQTN
jgi:nitroreductase